MVPFGKRNRAVVEDSPHERGPDVAPGAQIGL